MSGIKSKKQLKAGLIGAGSSATNIAETIKHTDGVDLVAISDYKKEFAQMLADKHDVEFVTNDYKQLCEREDIDFVIVSVPHGLHYEITMYALEQGKHVLTEKPIATEIKHAEDMINLAKKMNLNLGVHFQCRFFGAVNKAKGLVDNGTLGKIVQVTIQVMWYRPPEYYANNWRGTWDLEGGGSLINQAIHPVDQMVYILGDVKSVFGYSGVKLHDIETEDNTAAAFIFENGAFGTLQTSTATKAAFPAKLTIFGTEGAVEIDGNILTIHKEDGTSEVIDYTGGAQVGSAKDPKKFSLGAHGAMMSDFRDSILENRPPKVSGEDGLKSLKVVRAVYESGGNKLIQL